MNHCTVGTPSEGANAYPPLLLLKWMLLQKWFQINSDPELVGQNPKSGHRVVGEVRPGIETPDDHLNMSLMRG